MFSCMHVFQDSTSSDEEMSVFMDHHRRAMSVQRDKESQMRWHLNVESSVTKFHVKPSQATALDFQNRSHIFCLKTTL